MNTKKSYWFWAWLIQITMPRLAGKKSRGLVWRNLILLRAYDAEEAIAKAEKYGMKAQLYSDESLTLGDRPAVTRFLGVEDMGLVHDLVYDEFHDGMEVLSTERRGTLSSAGKRLRGKKTISASIERELRPYIKVNSKVKPRGKTKAGVS